MKINILVYALAVAVLLSGLSACGYAVELTNAVISGAIGSDDREEDDDEDEMLSHFQQASPTPSSAPPSNNNAQNAPPPDGGDAADAPSPSAPPPSEDNASDAPPVDTVAGSETASSPAAEPGSTPQSNSRLDDYLPIMPFPYSFALTDLKGNPINEESLGSKRLFFVHFWGTWCGPCIQEMPDLAQLAIDFGDRVGFLGLLDDFDSNPGGAIQIMESSGVPQSFITVDAHSGDMAGLLDMVRSGYVPTTVILDGYGEMITEQLIGAYGELYADVLEYIFDYFS